MIEALQTIQQFMVYKQVSRTTVYRWMELGKIKAMRSPNGKHFYVVVNLEHET